MITPQEILGHISGGRVLDVATGSGGFIHFLLEGFKEYREITGIDTNPRAAEVFEHTFKDQHDVHFVAMNALQMDFASASFDTVSISNSLHHFDEPQVVLQQMLRVLRPGGYFIISEMYCDGQTEAQLTHVDLHHWWAAVDRATGVIHHETYRREELIGLANHLGLIDLVNYDLSSLEEDPKNPEIIQELEPVFERYIQRAEGHADLQSRAAELRRRLQAVGFHSATTLVVLGKKGEIS